MDHKKLNIKQWAEEDRPREKMMQKGIHSLSDAELLAILIGSGNRDETAVELSRRILSSAQNNLNELGKFSITDLQKNFKGIGQAKAITIAAALEIGRRRKNTDALDKAQIRCSQDIFNQLFPLLQDLPHEEFWVLLVNRANRIIAPIKISQGGTDGTVVDTRLILKMAIEKLASGIAICHNHPSGNKTPSENDIKLTGKIKTACLAVDIAFLDHIIIAGNDYYSFADENIL